MNINCPVLVPLWCIRTGIEGTKDENLLRKSFGDREKMAYR